jgi:adenylate cyclase
MAEPWQIRVYEKQQLVYSGDLEGPTELGRQGEGTERIFSRRLEGGRCRLVIAGRDEDSVSRKHALLEPLAKGRLRVTNLSAKVPIRLQDGDDVRPGQARELAMPAFLLLGRKTIRVQEAASEDNVECLQEATIPPGASASAATAFGTLALPMGVGNNEIESLVRWLRSTMEVFQSAAHAEDFYRKAAQAVVENVGLDSGRVLLLEGEDWETKAVKAAPGVVVEEHWQPSRRVLNKVLTEKRTFWHSPSTGADAASLSGINVVITSPILDRHGEVIGVLYADRRQARGFNLTGRTPKVDAMLVELLAGGMAAGLARLEQEQAALAAQVQFEQFFTPELARAIAANPEMLKGQDAEITVLFCDIRGFSRVSHNLPTYRVVEWIADVMGTLSDCVRRHKGVLVDYIGDEVMAMWGAPDEQPDHAQLACRAALDMLQELPKMNDRWRDVLREEMGLGIGINTGWARVGNTGSHCKFKYGPLGTTVNLASRVQGMTKYLRTRLLVTEATRARLGSEVESRRIGKARMVNIQTPVDLYELMPAGQDKCAELCRDYEASLSAFERREFREALRTLAGILREHFDDGPSLVLLSRVTACRIDPDAFDEVFDPGGK